MKILHSNLIGDSDRHLFIIHGFLGMGDNWKSHAKKISDYNYTVHLIDLRNHGRSFWDNKFSFEIMVDDIQNYALFHNIEKFSLLGHSMGGNVSMLFAQKFPEIIEKIIIVDIIPKKYKSHHNEIMDGLKSIDFKSKKSRREVDDHMSNYIQDNRVKQFLLKNLYWIDKENLGLKINIDVLYEFKDKLSLELQNNLNYQKPTMFLYGDLSPYVKNSDLPILKSYFTNIQIFKVPQAGHWVHADNPSFFLDRVINFLN